MANLIGNFFESSTNRPADETLAKSTMGAAAATAQAYLTATLTSTTPEVRRLFSEYTTEAMIGHESITSLCLAKGWIKPYDAPQTQLKTSIDQSQQIISQNNNNMNKQ